VEHNTSQSPPPPRPPNSDTTGQHHRITTSHNQQHAVFGVGGLVIRRPVVSETDGCLETTRSKVSAGCWVVDDGEDGRYFEMDHDVYRFTGTAVHVR